MFDKVKVFNTNCAIFLAHPVCVFVTVTSLRIVIDGNKETTYLLTYSHVHLLLTHSRLGVSLGLIAFGFGLDLGLASASTLWPRPLPRRLLASLTSQSFCIIRNF